jgi:predicted DNA-binding protein (UPF0251 family)
MTAAQFTALATLLRLRDSETSRAVRLVLVEGMSVPDAAAQAGADYRLAWQAVKRAREGLDLAKTAAGLV